MKLDTIVVGMDFSPASLAAAEWAMRKLPAGSRFVLLHTVSAPTLPTFLHGVLDAPDGLPQRREEALGRLRELAAALPDDEVHMEVAVGKAAAEIVAAAERLGADLILLGPHGQRFTPWDALGSVAEEAVRCAHVPVLIGRGLDADGVQRILVGIDEGSADAVLPWAAFLARHFDASLLLVHVLDLGLYGAAATARSPDVLEERQETAQAATRAWLLARAEAGGVDPGVVETRVVFGEPKFEIVRAAEQHEADLILLGNRGPAQVEPGQLGGTAGSVIRGSRLPVLVVTSG